MLLLEPSLALHGLKSLVSKICFLPIFPDLSLNCLWQGLNTSSFPECSWTFSHCFLFLESPSAPCLLVEILSSFKIYTIILDLRSIHQAPKGFHETVTMLETCSGGSSQKERMNSKIQKLQNQNNILKINLDNKILNLIWESGPF